MGRQQGDLKERTLRFGVATMEAIARLPNDARGSIVAKQLGRSATGIGANIWEADGALSDADFAHKVSIALKEASETQYWLELSQRLHLWPEANNVDLLPEAVELSKILATIVRRTQEHARKVVRSS